jgi:glyoxylase-like metal-dependent hydrolase (beta-lactamase superfamily II)
MTYIKSNGLSVEYVILTHGHIDHIANAEKLRAETNAKLLLHEEDKYWIEPPEYMLALITEDYIRFLPDIYPKDSEKYFVGRYEFEIIHTPGHTKGGICIYFKDNRVALKTRLLNCGGLEPAQLSRFDHEVKNKNLFLEVPNNILFSGDTLFQESIGRTDLYGGSSKTLLESIFNKLLVLPDDTIVYPGHGEETKIKYEKQYNPFLQNTGIQ